MGLGSPETPSKGVIYTHELFPQMGRVESDSESQELIVPQMKRHESSSESEFQPSDSDFSDSSTDNENEQEDTEPDLQSIEKKKCKFKSSKNETTQEYLVDTSKGKHHT